MRYTRDELEALSGAPSPEAQALLWAEAQAALAAAGFSGDYDGLLATDEPLNRRGKKYSGGGRKAAAAAQFSGKALLLLADPRGWTFPALSRFICCSVSDWHLCSACDVAESTETTAWRNGDLGVHQAIGESVDQCEGVEYDEDDSDDDYDGILKPAFAVDGEPDFESGEPLDGFEYLRRVRYALLIVLF
jgi:survival of motor neuron protein-interacting protein 1